MCCPSIHPSIRPSFHLLSYCAVLPSFHPSTFLPRAIVLLSSHLLSACLIPSFHPSTHPPTLCSVCRFICAYPPFLPCCLASTHASIHPCISFLPSPSFPPSGRAVINPPGTHPGLGAAGLDLLPAGLDGQGMEAPVPSPSWRQIIASFKCILSVEGNSFSGCRQSACAELIVTIALISIPLVPAPFLHPARPGCRSVHGLGAGATPGVPTAAELGHTKLHIAVVAYHVVQGPQRVSSARLQRGEGLSSSP